jgi:hypothetical protein
VVGVITNNPRVDDALAKLPPVPDGYVRLLRVEHKDNPMLGRGSGLHVDWCHLPTPYTEGVQMRDTEVCAATPEQFNDWWPDEVLNFLSDYERHLVAIDVHQEHVTITRRQAVLLRSAAEIAGVILQ